MSFLSKIWDKVEHDAKPLLTAATAFAEAEGQAIVREVRAEVEAAGKAGLIDLFNRYVGAKLGVKVMPGETLSDFAYDLLQTTMAREKASTAAGDRLRVAVLNEAIEQAVLLVKGASGDVKVAPPSALPSSGTRVLTNA